jgi:MFS family permease
MSRDRIDRDFPQIWLGQTISLLGTQVSALAIPVTVAIASHASPAQMGFLGASQWLPFLVIGLPAGAWIDRRLRRSMMIHSDVGPRILIWPTAAIAPPRSRHRTAATMNRE